MRILLATDGSDRARVAVDLVAGMRWPIGSSVRAVRVVEPRSREVDPHLVIEAELDLEGVAAGLTAHGLKVDRSILRGRPADELVDDIRAHRPDLVIVGNRGHSAFDRMLLGSVSAELVDHSPVPVLVARKPSIERVVVAVDGSSIASEAVDAIRCWPFLSGAEIRVLTIAPMPVAAWVGLVPGQGDLATGAFEEARSRGIAESRVFAVDAADALRSAGLDAEPEVRVDAPAGGIVAFADEWSADLIIMGSHGRTGVARLVLGSVARNVLHHAGCSVLIVKRHAEPRLVGEPAFGIPAWSLGASH
jgi:nucleotide-binding universal stress UspA family protein